MTRQIIKIICGLTILVYSCGQSAQNENNSVSDTLTPPISKAEKERLERRKLIEEQFKLDSLRLDSVLIDAFKIANQNIDKQKFSKEYEIILDTIFKARVEITIDNPFSNIVSHLIIRRHGLNDDCIDIYYKFGQQFKKVLSHKQWTMTYVNDTIRDINGDGLKDFVVNWYGSSGCCLKAFSDVYLLRDDQKSFSDKFEFINPTFSPDEKIIRGVCYGHPGETEMYKYKWSNSTIDTLEYIYYEINEKGKKTGKLIVSKGTPSEHKQIIKKLNSVPKEYKTIDGYDWFNGNLNGNR